MGVTIHIKRNRIEIHNYILGEPPYIEKTFSVYDVVSKKYDKNKKYYLYDIESNTLILPRYCNYLKLADKLNSVGIIVDHIYSEIKDYIPYDSMNLKIRNNYKPRNDFQKSSIEFLSNIRNDTHAKLLRLPTGEGKTFCAISASINIDRKTIILTDTLVDQWIDAIVQFVNINIKDIYEIRGSDSVNDLFRMKNPKFKYYICSLKTIQMCVDSNLLYDLFAHLKVGLKIIDEGHKNTYALFKIDVMAPISETIYLTATPMRSNPVENTVYQNAFKMLPTFGQSVENNMDKYHNIIYVEYNTRPNPFEIKNCLNIYGFSLGDFADHIFSIKNIEKIVYIIKDLLNKILTYGKPEDKVVIILERNKHIDKLSKYLEKEYNIPIGKFCTLIKNMDTRLLELDKKIILSTFKSIGDGRDLPRLRCIINTTTFASPVTAKQIIGRLRKIEDAEVYYIDMCDMGFPNTVEHQISRKKVFSHKAKSVKTIDYTKL